METVNRHIVIFLMLLLPALVGAQEVADSSSVDRTSNLTGVTVVSKATKRRNAGAENGMFIGQGELFRAACCNLGESFSANPSVDVSYSDAATGAKQIKLLGLAGTYVQMLTENIPNFRGTAAPFALGYVPGTWMKGINVSKGASSVKNGYESITGQIDIEYLKPEDEEHINVNLYGDIHSRAEVNADANFHVGAHASTVVMGHYENRWGHHDANHDGFQDMPKVQQGNINNRWNLVLPHYIMHAGIGALKESRNSGQVSHSVASTYPLYNIGIESERVEAYMKHAVILNHEKQMNIALIANGSLHDVDATFGYKGYRGYSALEKNAYAQLIYEATFDEQHQISAGASVNQDYFSHTESETTPGVYAQYTYTPSSKLTLMAGLRWDHSSLYGGFVTPRAHIKYQPNRILGIRLSAGKGYRTPHALAENFNLLASGRTLQVDKLTQEEAWNCGTSLAFTIPVGEKLLKLNTEYYYTHFLNQSVVDYEMDASRIIIHNLTGRSFSHVFQIDATCEVVKGLEVTAAYRHNDVKCTYNGTLMTKPLTSKYKGLLSLSYKTPLELWQADVTLQLNGGGRLPNPYPSYKAFEQLSAQVTRRFRHVDVYVGGENLTNRRQRCPILGAENPWSSSFEPTLIYGSVEGAMAYAGVRIKY